jgi:transglutaminase-like putative cysteine protease
MAGKVLLMRQLMRAHGARPELRELAFRILRAHGVASRDQAGMVRALQVWTQAHRYAREPGEQFAGPDAVVRQGGGDCDDLTILLGALLESLGIPTKIEVLGWRDPKGRMVYRHVYLRAKVGAAWPAAEVIHRVPLGWDPWRRTIQARLQGRKAKN